jgi:hypothetical protein
MAAASPSPYSAIAKMRREFPQSYVIQLATVNSQGKPKVRSVLFEDLNRSEKEEVLISMKCSAKSNKFANAIEEGKTTSDAEVCWWVEDSNVQWRFSGRVDLISDGDERRRLWDHMNAGGKGQFLLPQDAGEMQRSTEELREKQIEKLNSFGNDQSAAFDAPMEDFLVCVLRCEEIDYLNLGTLERRNWIYDVEKASYNLRKDGVCVPVVSSVKNA